MDHGEHCNYRSTLASKLGLRGGGEKERSTMPIKRASGGSIPKLETGGAFRNLGKAIKHDVVHAANKVASGAKNFARKKKEGFEEFRNDINKNAIKPARRYLDESMHKDDNGMKRGGYKKYANGGMPRPMYPAVMPPQGRQGRRMPPNAQSYAPQQPMPMKRGGKTRHYEDGGEAMAAGGVGKMRHEAMPKTGGSVNSPMRNRKDYM